MIIRAVKILTLFNVVMWSGFTVDRIILKVKETKLKKSLKQEREEFIRKYKMGN